MLLALSGIHKSGIAHKDIRLETIMVDEVNWEPIYTSFGLACFNEGCEPGVASPIYAAPELFFITDTEHTERQMDADLYAVGVTLFIVKFGVPPYEFTDVGSYLSLVSENMITTQLTNSGDPLLKLLGMLLDKDYVIRRNAGPAALAQLMDRVAQSQKQSGEHNARQQAERQRAEGQRAERQRARQSPEERKARLDRQQAEKQEWESRRVKAEDDSMSPAQKRATIESNLAILGIPEYTENIADIKKVYKRAALKAHPDRGGSAGQSAALAGAYNTIVRLLSG